LIAKIVGDYGVMVVIVAVFLWDKVKMSKAQLEISQTNKSLLESVEKGMHNISVCLTLLQESTTRVEASQSSLHKRFDDHNEKHVLLDNSTHEIRVDIGKMLEYTRDHAAKGN
jgi:hypothetical protein